MRQNILAWITIALTSFAVISLSGQGIFMTIVYSALIASISGFALFVLDCMILKFDNMFGLTGSSNTKENYINPSDYYGKPDDNIYNKHFDVERPEHGHIEMHL